MIESIQKEKCTGCKMCADVCPKQAITFSCDQEGFWYPRVNIEQCIECGICVHRCPSLNREKVKTQTDPMVYAVWSKDDHTRISSTSGGAFYEIGKYFIDQGGVVAGCRYGTDWKSAEHMIAYDYDGLLQVKGSKYFQSDTAGIYHAVKKEVESGKLVLFCGTPCQCAALSMFLGKAYPNLYYMDFICRSINSPLAFRKYISELEKEYDAKVVKVHLKNKETGWQSLASQVCFANGKETIRDKNKDWWVKGFIYNDLYTRESCYHCQYKVIPRVVADVTIGDFWGIKGQSQEDMFKGISVVLLNSEKGKEIFGKIQDRFAVQEHSLEEVLPGNPALLKNPVRTKKQDKFFKLINKNKRFSSAVKACIEESFAVKAVNNVKKVGNRIKRKLRLFCKENVSVRKYIYYNYMCKNIVRDSKSKIIPYRGAVLDLHPSARIYLHGRNLEIGYNQLRGSKSETHVRMNEGAVWNCNNGATLFYNTVFEIKKYATIDSGYFSANGGSVIIADKHIIFGDDVMIGRNVIVYDSDFHQLRNSENVPINPPKTVIVEDHVWLTSNITVLKGVTIGKGSLVTAQTVVNKSMPEHSIVAGKSSGHVIKDDVNWNRDRCPRE